ncbi:MAG TPA: glycosyltransferase [Vicinamibacterales bacterium]|nr:glycosyltransferase [Vicinamibacterales bacterium]
MRRVLFVSPHFPPDSSAGTHRVRLLAPHMAGHGWEPTVLTVDPADYEGALDAALAASVPENVRVVRTRAWPASITRRLGIGDLGLRAYRGLKRAAIRLLERERFDAVFITIYPTYPALLGPYLKRRFGVAFVLDYQDPWVGEWGRSVGPAAGRPDLKSRASRWIATCVEPIALTAADGITAVSHATYEQALARTPAAKPRATAELPIGWDARDLQFVERKNLSNLSNLSNPSGLVHVSYVGTLLPTGIETLRAVFAALAAARDCNADVARLRLHFFGTSNMRSTDARPRVLPLAAQYGLSEIVTEHAPRLDYFDALGVLQASHAVLLLGSHERHYTPSKVFPALAAERPVFAVMHEASNATDLLRRVGTAPTVRLVTYGDDGARMRVAEIGAELAALAGAPRYTADAVDRTVLEPVSACALAGTLANVLERCVA